jgi:hypothetical protein
VLLHRLHNADDEPIAVPPLYALVTIEGAVDLGDVKSLRDPRILASAVFTADQFRAACHTWLEGLDRDARGDLASHEGRVRTELAASKDVAERTVATLRKLPEKGAGTTK